MATAKSAMNGSSVSPERCEIMNCQFALPAQVDCLDRLGYCADLIELNQHRICCAFGNSALNELCIGDIDVVSDDLNSVAKLCGQRAKAIPVIFAEPILD